MHIIHSKTRIIPEKISTNRALSSTFLNYFVFLAIIICIIWQLRRDESAEDNKTNNLFNWEEPNFDGVECAYTYRLKEKNIQTWTEFEIMIIYRPDDKCRNITKHLLYKDGAGAVFRVQLHSIYELISGTSEYLNNGVYKVKLRLTIPTRYIVTILLTYVNNQATEDIQHVRPILREISGSPFEINARRSRTNNSEPSTYCTSNVSGVVSGRWLKCGSIIPNLERCGPWQTPEFDFDRIHYFRWVPYECQYHTYTNTEIKRCFARHGWDSIVFAGDSHMRYRAYHWVTRLYGSCSLCVKTHIKMVFEKVPRIEWVFDARGTRLPLSFKNITLPFEKYIHPKVRRSKFSTPFPEDALDSKLFLLNFGHWVLRESVDLDFISQKLYAYAEALKILMRQGKTVLWVNTVSLPWRTDQAVKNWRENTSPYRVRHFNRIADKIMQQHGIPIINTYDISDGRIAATHDQTHYTKRLVGNDFGGVVENAISNAIFNKLCNEVL